MTSARRIQSSWKQWRVSCTYSFQSMAYKTWSVKAFDFWFYLWFFIFGKMKHSLGDPSHMVLAKAPSLQRVKASGVPGPGEHEKEP